MRDIFNDPDGSAHPGNPVANAQAQMRKPLPKRFYSDVTVAEGEGGHAIHLDGRPVKTPARKVLAVANMALAQLLREEWAAQREEIDPLSMPVTRLVNTALDAVAGDTAPVFDDILRFAEGDMLLYRAQSPQELAARQKALWDPVLDWAKETVGARFLAVDGVMPVLQPEGALSAFADALRRHAEPVRLSALHQVTTLTGSALLALAFAEGRVSGAEAWELAHVEEDWNRALWGVDAESEKRRAGRWLEMRAAIAVFEALARPA